jgi:hypothetical protein
MRFTFGKPHISTTFLYLIGVPIVVMMVLDRYFGWRLVDQTLNLQLFLIGAILVTVGGVINLALTIRQNLRRN